MVCRWAAHSCGGSLLALVGPSGPQITNLLAAIVWFARSLNVGEKGEEGKYVCDSKCWQLYTWQVQD
jgi:hypothetical protein